MITKNYSLKNSTTFAVEAKCTHFAEPTSVEELKQCLTFAHNSELTVQIIGEGSNILFTKDFSGLIIHPQMRGIHPVQEKGNDVFIECGAGENWDNFVSWCVKNNYYGAENLSGIPGSVGASPVQNIGAYGVEAKDIIQKVEVLNTSTNNIEVFDNNACLFEYRNSFFKQSMSGLYIVTKVTYKLQKKAELKLDYGRVKEVFLNEAEQNLQSLRKVIVDIRNSKLPDHTKIGNGGSYFKNPIIPNSQFETLKKEYPNVPCYPAGAKHKKIPAAWLIEQAGWKGIREGDAGTWPMQPLVIVNYGNATGKEVFEFSEKIQTDIMRKFNISLEREVLILPS